MKLQILLLGGRRIKINNVLTDEESDGIVEGIMEDSIVLLLFFGVLSLLDTLDFLSPFHVARVPSALIALYQSCCSSSSSVNVKNLTGNDDKESSFVKVHGNNCCESVRAVLRLCYGCVMIDSLLDD